jgi:hypothetical protein
MRFTHASEYGDGAQSQSGPDEETPLDFQGSGYITESTQTTAINARTATIAANSPNLKGSFDDFDGFQRNLGVGFFMKRAG